MMPPYRSAMHESHARPQLSIKASQCRTVVRVKKPNVMDWPLTPSP
jgi:hypothetical protein